MEERTGNSNETDFFDAKAGAWRIVDGVDLQGRPGAGRGSFVFVSKQGEPVLATVEETGDCEYLLTPRGGGSGRIVDMKDNAGDGCWINSPLPECCICYDAGANCVLPCPCSSLRVCSLCIPSIDACPICRAAVVTALVPLGPHHRGNVASLEPPCMWGDITVYMKTLTGNCKTLTVRRNQTAFDLKARFFGRDDPPPTCTGAITFAGHRLDERLTLSFYNIQKESTLYIDMRIRGD
jgi:hypothetical protein